MSQAIETAKLWSMIDQLRKEKADLQKQLTAKDEEIVRLRKELNISNETTVSLKELIDEIEDDDIMADAKEIADAAERDRQALKESPHA